MKRRTGDPWMAAADYGRTLRGLSVNLLVADVERALGFQRHVLRAEIVYADPDFAVVRGYDGEWMFHADHAYDGHPLQRALSGITTRGAGVELRLHGCDPDAATNAARTLGFVVVTEPADTPHGLREAHLADADGYVWVPDVPTSGARS